MSSLPLAASVSALSASMIISGEQDALSQTTRHIALPSKIVWKVLPIANSSAIPSTDLSNEFSSQKNTAFLEDSSLFVQPVPAENKEKDSGNPCDDNLLKCSTLHLSGLGTEGTAGNAVVRNSSRSAFERLFAEPSASHLIGGVSNITTIRSCPVQAPLGSTLCVSRVGECFVVRSRKEDEMIISVFPVKCGEREGPTAIHSQVEGSCICSDGQTTAYCFGGWRTSTIESGDDVVVFQRRVLKLDVLSGKVSFLPCRSVRHPPGVAFHSCILYGDSMCVFGGYLDWTPKRSTSSVVSHIKSRNTSITDNSMFCSDASRPTVFEPLSHMPKLCATMRCSNSVYIYEIPSGSWNHVTCGGNVPCARARHSGCVVDDWMIVVGGVGQNSCAIHDMNMLHIRQRIWIEIDCGAQPLYGMSEHFVKVVGHSIVIGGGGAPLHTAPVSDVVHYARTKHRIELQRLQCSDDSAIKIRNVQQVEATVCRLFYTSHSDRAGFVPRGQMKASGPATSPTETFRATKDGGTRVVSRLANLKFFQDRQRSNEILLQRRDDEWEIERTRNIKTRHTKESFVEKFYTIPMEGAKNAYTRRMEKFFACRGSAAKEQSWESWHRLTDSSRSHRSREKLLEKYGAVSNTSLPTAPTEQNGQKAKKQQPSPFSRMEESAIKAHKRLCELFDKQQVPRAAGS